MVYTSKEYASADSRQSSTSSRVNTTSVVSSPVTTSTTVTSSRAVEVITPGASNSVSRTSNSTRLPTSRSYRIISMDQTAGDASTSTRTATSRQTSGITTTESLTASSRVTAVIDPENPSQTTTRTTRSVSTPQGRTNLTTRSVEEVSTRSVNSIPTRSATLETSRTAETISRTNNSLTDNAETEKTASIVKSDVLAESRESAGARTATSSERTIVKRTDSTARSLSDVVDKTLLSDDKESTSLTSARTSRTGTQAPMRSSLDSSGDQSVIQGSDGSVISETQDATQTGDQTNPITIDGDYNTVINGNVYVKGCVRSCPRPYYVTRRYTRLYSPCEDWYNYGSYWGFQWYSGSCGLMVCLPYDDYWGMSYYYPRYHRRYLFCSLGGYWPSYRYRRYYWYGCHPYRWYGSNVINVDVPMANGSVAYHHYYYDDGLFDGSNDPAVSYQETQYSPSEDNETDSQVLPEDLPEDASIADKSFEAAVTAFESGQYDQAMLKFRLAMIMEPEDQVLPFAYSQALFAAGHYSASTGILRTVLNGMPEDEDKKYQQTVYYPRGLYTDQELLEQQVSQLAQAIQKDPTNTDLQLLYGYHLLGTGSVQEAREPLQMASLDPANKRSVEILLALLEQIVEEQKSFTEKIGMPLETADKTML